MVLHNILLQTIGGEFFKFNCVCVCVCVYIYIYIYIYIYGEYIYAHLSLCKHLQKSFTILSIETFNVELTMPKCCEN